MSEKLVVSFSGGKTSAYMARYLQLEYGDHFKIKYVFANTGQEREETLEFVHRCDKEWNLDLVWVESVMRIGRKSSGYRMVNFDSASRRGEPFEAMITKYGIPNKSYPHCTRELKLNPIYSYLTDMKWKNPMMAIGIRADEPKRLRTDAESVGIVYPLAHWFPTDKQDINAWWEQQSFNLQLREHEGNCSWCWKKSLTKHFRLIDEHPEIFMFPDRMEREHGNTNARHGTRVFFRESRSTVDLFRLRAEHGKLPPLSGDDEDSGCSESCDINAEIFNHV